MAKKTSKASFEIGECIDGYYLVWVEDGEPGATVGEIEDISTISQDPNTYTSYEEFLEAWEYVTAHRTASITGERRSLRRMISGFFWPTEAGAKKARSAIYRAFEQGPTPANWKPSEQAPTPADCKASERPAWEAEAIASGWRQPDRSASEKGLRDMGDHMYSDGFRGWKVRDLIQHAENIPVEVRPLSDFSSVLLEIPAIIWGLSNMADMLEHTQRILNADESFPILMHNNVIVDGYHRILKAQLKNLSSVPVKVLVEMPPPSKQAKS